MSKSRMASFNLIVNVYKGKFLKDEGTKDAVFRVSVDAINYQEACREIIHTRMKRGHGVRSIREVAWGEE